MKRGVGSGRLRLLRRLIQLRKESDGASLSVTFNDAKELVTATDKGWILKVALLDEDRDYCWRKTRPRHRRQPQIDYRSR